MLLNVFFFVNENNRLKEKGKKNNVNVIELTTPCIWNLFMRNQTRKKTSQSGKA